MSEFILNIGSRTVELDPDIVYNVYGEDKDADEIIDMDFGHLNWLDQKLLIQSIQLNDEISILFHPEVIGSLLSDVDASPYWQKNRFDALSLFRRNQQKEPDAKDQKRKRKMAKDVDLKDNKIVQKRFRIVNKLVASGYERPDAMEFLTAVIELHGTGLMNLSPDEIIEFVDVFSGVKEDDDKLKYFTKDSQVDCILYYLKFTHLETGEEFKKIGITTRTLAERFIRDKLVFKIELIHTVTLTAETAQLKEKEVLDAFKKKYDYTPETKLLKGGNTEIMSCDLPDGEVMQIMGQNQLL